VHLTWEKKKSRAKRRKRRGHKKKNTWISSKQREREIVDADREMVCLGGNDKEKNGTHRLLRTRKGYIKEQDILTSNGAPYFGGAIEKGDSKQLKEEGKACTTKKACFLGVNRA